jgi:hypothetical protein
VTTPADWRRLAALTSTPMPISLAQVEPLPAAVRDWLAHSIAVGTPLWRSAELRMRAEIRLGQWRRFTARQVLAPPAGFIWAATAWLGVLPVSGYMTATPPGEGRMRWRLLGGPRKASSSQPGSSSPDSADAPNRDVTFGAMKVTFGPGRPRSHAENWTYPARKDQS